MDPNDPMSPSTINRNGGHVSIAASSNYNGVRSLLFEWYIDLANQLLAGWRKSELGECFSQGV